MPTVKQVKNGMVNKGIHKNKVTGNRKTKSRKYKIAGRVAVQKRNAPIAPMAGPFQRGPLTSTAQVMARMKGLSGPRSLSGV